MTTVENRIDTLLRIVVDKKASDLHLAVGSPPSSGSTATFRA